jgi:hypothetical protein
MDRYTKGPAAYAAFMSLWLRLVQRGLCPGATEPGCPATSCRKLLSTADIGHAFQRVRHRVAGSGPVPWPEQGRPCSIVRLYCTEPKGANKVSSCFSGLSSAFVAELAVSLAPGSCSGCT